MKPIIQLCVLTPYVSYQLDTENHMMIKMKQIGHIIPAWIVRCCKNHIY